MSYYQDDIHNHSNAKEPPEDALSFLSWVPEREITDRERCAILRATLEVVLERLQKLENSFAVHKFWDRRARG